MKAHMPDSSIRYAGFWVRVGASVLDTVCLLPVLIGLALLVGPATSGSSFEQLWWEHLMPNALVLAITLSFWLRWGATPGKLILGLRIVQADTLDTPTMKQFLLRYLGYIPASLPLLLGLLWVGWDDRKQGWHDKLAGTIVIQK